MKNKLLSYLVIIIGGSMTAAAFGLFVLQQGFVAGGVTGLSIILSPFLHLPVSWVVLCINIILFALGWVFAGREFIFKTMIMTFLFPVMLEVFSKITYFKALSSDPFMSSIIAGCLLGIGSGLILRANGSSGGFDILGVVLNKKFGVPISAVMYVCDCSVILFQAVQKPLTSVIYGIIVILCCSVMINKIITHGEAKVQLLVFSKEMEEIRRQLLKTYDTGVTMLNAETGYTEKSTKIILTILPYNKVGAVKKMIYSVDPYAFTIINNVNYVGGRGYSIHR